MSKAKADQGTASAFGLMDLGRGVRGLLYGLCFLLLFLWATLGYFLVYIQYLPPHPTDDYCGLTAFLCLWLSVFAFVDNPGEVRTRIQKWEEQRVRDISRLPV